MRSVDLNTAVEEALNLAYHGARADKPGFNVRLVRNYDPAAGSLDLYPQEFCDSHRGRCIFGRAEYARRRSHRSTEPCGDPVGKRNRSATDSAVLDALNAAERRGVVIRIVLDPRERHDFVELGDLADNVRIKRGGPFMHLKAYAIDGEALRTGSANFSTSGENMQDNDLIVIGDAAAAAKFEAHFERMWDAAQPMIEFEPAIKALEPQ